MALSLDEIGAILADFRRLLLCMIPAVLALACAGGYWLSSRALAPVDAITSVAKTISVQNLSRRIAPPQTGDELQRMAETWNEVLDRLESSVQRIRQFTSDASHELRTPLTLIRATADLALRREREPSEYRASLRQIAAEAEHMTALTEQLLTLARADTHGLEMALTATDLNPLVDSVARQNAALALEKGVALHARTAAQPAVAAADAAGLRRVLLILVDNALKIHPARRLRNPVVRPGRRFRGPGCRGHRRGHCGGSAAASLRALLPRRRGPGQQQWQRQRIRTRSRHRAGHRLRARNKN